ncbi:hypothetical protein CQW23_04825 [Capsicum baccatum]|uniref:Uncharacterized protein n=1 Tax=Capsicum baccatum TaxID=33114 RepID=A0A2G2XFV1_CAPBA|nr:hypothetical protein CQW23_04825 [Capsicum baccatum]
MSEIGEILGFGLQEFRRKRVIEARTMAELLRERMDGSDRIVSRRKSLTERLGFTGSIACCGATLCLRPASLSAVDDDGDGDGVEEPLHPPPEIECLGHIPAGSGMNLAAALLAERNLRSAQDSEGSGPNRSPDGPGTAQGTPHRMSLMRLLEETNGWDEKEEEGAGNDRKQEWYGYGKGIRDFELWWEKTGVVNWHVMG